MNQTKEYQFLVYSKNGLDNITKELLAHNGKLIAGKASPNGTPYDLLVLDGRSATPDDMKGFSKYALEALNVNKPVLVVGATGANKKILRENGAMGTYVQEDSAALLIEPRKDAAGNLKFSHAEQFFGDNSNAKLVRCSAAVKGGKVDPAGGVELALAPFVPVAKDYAPFIKRVRKTVETLSSGLQLDASDDSTPSNPPATIPAGLYDVTPNTMYWAWNCSGTAQDGYTPPNGSIYIEGLATVGVYYDNTSFNTPVQWLLIEHSGLYYTAGLEENNDSELGWSVGEFSINGQNISSSTMVSKQSSPNNVNNQTSFTSSSEFTVGVSAGTDGLSGNASYSIGSSQTSTISDWSIVQSDPNTWDFYQTVPYIGQAAYIQQNGFPSGARTSCNDPVPLPSISTGSLAFCSQSVYTQLPAAQNTMSVPYTFGTNSLFLYCSGGYGYMWLYFPSFGQTYAVDFSDAWPSS
jgi:hypothetical protein